MTPPSWIKNAIIYQIFPDRFYNGDSTNDPENIQNWGSKPTLWGFQGGDLFGIIQKLDYLIDLGINTIYLNPIFKAASNHRYDTIDYFQVDPNLGTMETFHELINAAHKNEIKVILDGVFNHTGRGFFAFNDLLENEENSSYRYWYHVYHFPIDAYSPGKAKDYAAWWGFKSLPKLNTDHQPVRDYLFSVAKYWIEQGADGWRLDVPNEIDDDSFWSEFQNIVRKTNPDAYICGEIWEADTKWVEKGYFDGLMNYPLRSALIDVLSRKISPTTFLQLTNNLLKIYPLENRFAMFNLLGSHDTERIRTILHDDFGLIRLAFLFIFTFIGAPVIYYGDEIGTRGGKDPECRRAFPWDPYQWDLHLQQTIEKFIQIRRIFPALRVGEFIPLNTDDEKDIFSFARIYEKNIFIMVFNCSDKSQTFEIKIDGLDFDNKKRLNNLIGEEFFAINQSNYKIPISIPPKNGFILH
ncbi:MAG: glycoside hydrolase family 13 protein [Anaerolineaceae bacterium]|nr:glycoside hydrolase family 13 protein [Anaerolineaceae bacterium]